MDEFTLHVNIASYLNFVIKEPDFWHSIEVSNQSGGVQAMLRQRRLRKKGVVTGFPDIEIYRRACEEPCYFRIIFLEIKTKVGKVSDKQKQIHALLSRCGHSVYVVREVEEVRQILIKEGII